jgi:MarR family transcriptional regulator, organic hydroperoxide resistance regulator
MAETDGTADWPTGRLLSAAARSVEHAWQLALAGIGVTHAGLIVLHLLEAGPAAQKDLAASARVSVQTMSRTLDRLERDGFVERTVDEADRRRSAVSRTAAGTAVFARARSLEDDVFPALDDPEALRRLLLQILHG